MGREDHEILHPQIPSSVTHQTEEGAFEAKPRKIGTLPKPNPTMSDPEAKRERLFWAATFLLAALPLFGWWLYGLFDLDEGFYAAVTSEMLRRGDWITPYYNGQPWFEKPILLYWAAAPFMALFGEDFGPRIPSVLANLGLYAMVGVFVARRTSPAAGRWTVLVLGLSPLMAIWGKMMMFDALFVLCLTGSFLALYRSFSEGWKWRLVSGLALGLAVLAKGPVAIVFWVLMMGVTAWRQPGIRRSVFDGTANTAAFFAMLAAIAIWYVPAYLANGQAFVQEFLIEQNIGRFTGGDKAHGVQWYLHPIYFPLILGVGLFPWSWRIVESWPRKIEEGEVGSSFFQFCAHWGLIVLVFFTISGTKLPHYILPAGVPIAILCARRLESPLFGLPTLLWGITLTVILNFAGISYYRSSGQEEAHRIARWLREQRGPVAVYQLSRRESDRGTGKLELKDTSLPSLGMVLGRNFIKTDDLTQVDRSELPVWVFTRKGRMRSTDLVRYRAERLVVGRVRPPLPTDKFEVWRLSAR